jgi:serine protease
LRLDPVPTAVEYHHRSFDHYFITALPNEISALDSGTFSGWERTGQSFGVLPLNAAGSANVCRFWSHQTFAPKSSHFYTPFDWECAIVKGDPVWSFEGEMFAINLPDQNGNCSAATLPLYRLYNDGQSAAPNHRYTTSRTIRADMIVKGWTPEGSGLGVIGCVLAQ